MIVVNFKRYVERDGAVGLARICKKFGVIACPQLTDLAACVETGVECWTQKHEPEAVGHTGTLLNHSDYRLGDEELKAQISKLKTTTLNFQVCVCCKDVEEGVRLADFGPDFLAFEPPELIGSREKSVATERPEDIRRLVLGARCQVLVGAGVHSGEDVRVALEMGAKGVLVATDVVRAVDPQRELRELVEAFNIGV